MQRGRSRCHCRLLRNRPDSGACLPWRTWSHFPPAHSCPAHSPWSVRTNADPQTAKSDRPGDRAGDDTILRTKSLAKTAPSVQVQVNRGRLKLRSAPGDRKGNNSSCHGMLIRAGTTGARRAASAVPRVRLTWIGRPDGRGRPVPREGPGVARAGRCVNVPEWAGLGRLDRSAPGLRHVRDFPGGSSQERAGPRPCRYPRVATAAIPAPDANVDPP